MIISLIVEMKVECIKSNEYEFSSHVKKAINTLCVRLLFFFLFLYEESQAEEFLIILILIANEFSQNVRILVLNNPGNTLSNLIFA